MEPPYLAERVRLDGHEQPFFVIKVDEELQTVDLGPSGSGARCLKDIPFAALRRTAVCEAGIFKLPRAM